MKELQAGFPALQVATKVIKKSSLGCSKAEHNQLVSGFWAKNIGQRKFPFFKQSQFV
jgi:hypothetical protein